MFVHSLPSPLDTVVTVGTNPDTEAEEERKAGVNEPTAALAFKIATDHLWGVWCSSAFTLVRL